MQNASSGKSKSGRTDQITISLHPGLLGMVDEAAKQDYTTRSDIIRTALLWYLRPQGRDLRLLDPETIVKVIKRRHDLAWMKKFMKEHGDEIDPYDC